jgi:toxin ParE1/3/4
MSLTDTMVITTRIDASLRAKLEALARSTKRSKSFLAAEAIAAYVELNEWQIGEITAGIKELDSGEALSEEQAEGAVSPAVAATVTPRRLEYAPRYFRRLEDIRERIAAESPPAAIRMVERIRAAVTRLAGSPALGRPGHVPGTRELVIPRTPYIVPYRVKGDVVQIITFLRSARRWPDRLP